MVNSKGVRLGKTALYDKGMQEEGELRGGYVKAWHAMPHWAFPIRTSAPSLSHVRSKIAIIVSIINRFMTSMTYALRDLSDTTVLRALDDRRSLVVFGVLENGQ